MKRARAKGGCFPSRFSKSQHVSEEPANLGSRDVFQLLQPVIDRKVVNVPSVPVSFHMCPLREGFKMAINGKFGPRFVREDCFFYFF